METGLSLISKNGSPIGYSDTTGLAVYESYQAPSGFNYMVGVREIKDLLIVEQIAEGTACTYLCGILLYHKESKQLLKEIPIENNSRYSRIKTMEIVSDSLLELINEATKKEGVDFNREHSKVFIDGILDTCYFELSRKTILVWAKSMGILNNQI